MTSMSCWSPRRSASSQLDVGAGGARSDIEKEGALERADARRVGDARAVEQGVDPVEDALTGDDRWRDACTRIDADERRDRARRCTAALMSLKPSEKLSPGDVKGGSAARPPR
jgi:hypothetical protein